MLGGGAVGLTVGGALGGPLGWGANIVRGLLLGGSALGGALAAYGFPQLMVMDLAARAGAVGGEKLTNQTPEEARMNLALGYANLALAGLDLGLTPGLIGKVARIPGAVRATAGLTRKQSQVLVNSMARHTGNLSDAALAKLLEAVKTADANTTLIVVNGDGSLSQMRPLEGVTERLESTTMSRASGKKKLKDMTPAERFVDAQQKYGQIKNWDQVKPLIGQTVNQNTQLPPGYVLYEKPPNAYGKRALFILRENADDGSFVPLMIEKGKIQAGKERLSRGLDVMKRNLKGVGVDVPKDWQVNHLIPDEIAQSNPLMIEALKRDLFDVDRASNLLPMPGKANARKANSKLIGHEGSHGNYSNRVDRQLSDRYELLRQRFGNNIPDQEIKKAIESVEGSMGKKILNRDSQIPVRKDKVTNTEVLSWQPLEQEDSQFLS